MCFNSEAKFILITDYFTVSCSLLVKFSFLFVRSVVVMAFLFVLVCQFFSVFVCLFVVVIVFCLPRNMSFMDRGFCPSVSAFLYEGSKIDFQVESK